jgi:hypothetical protein
MWRSVLSQGRSVPLWCLRSTNAAIASASESTTPSRTTDPIWFTTQIDVASTTRPAQYSAPFPLSVFRGHVRIASCVPGELIPFCLRMARSESPHVAKAQRAGKYIRYVAPSHWPASGCKLDLIQDCQRTRLSANKVSSLRRCVARRRCHFEGLGVDVKTRSKAKARAPRVDGIARVVWLRMMAAELSFRTGRSQTNCNYRLSGGSGRRPGAVIAECLAA